MAEAVAGAIAYFATGTYVYGAAAYMGYAYVVVAASAIAYSGYASRKAEARARAAANASAKDREVMIRSAIAPRRIVYGRDRISGPIVYMESTGDKSQYLHMVVALAAHECDAIETVYFNEVALPEPDGDGWITSGEYTKGGSTQAETHTGTTNGSGQLTLPRNAESITAAYTEIGVGESATQTHHTGYSHTAGSNTITGLPADTSVTIGYTYTQAATPLVRVRKYLGTDDQTACADLVAESDGKWTSDHRGRGICYLYVRLEYDQDVFGSTGVPNISAVVRGKKVYDPRTTTTAWSNNAALCVADYLRSDEGMRADSAEVPDSEIIAAANICDEEIDLSLDDEDVQARYTCDLSITTDRSPRDVLAELLACMSGRAVWTQGRWLVRPGAYRTPTLTITADMLAGPVSVMPKASRSELFNAIRATYRDAETFAELQAPLVENSGYEADDGGVQIVRQIDVPTLSDTYRAQRLAKIELERARQAVTVKLACNLKAYDLAPSDTVLLTLATYGWSAKPFEVLERTLTREGTIQYTLRETAAGVYDWAWGEATIGDLAPDTNLPNPFGLPAILQNLAADEDAIRLGDGTIVTQAVVTWDQSTSPFVPNGGSIQYQTAKVGTPWGTGSLPGDATTVTLGPLQVGVAYVFRARAINASGRAGDWAYIGLVAEGLAAPPDDVTGLAYEIKPGQVWITWDPCEEADYAATELRYDGTGWADATFLWRGAGSDYQHPRPPNGTYIVRAKHLDTSGNYSVNAASISVTVDDSIDPAGGGGLLRLTADRFPYFSFSSGTTHTAQAPGDGLITITAQLIRLVGTATITAEAFDASDASLGAVTLGGSGNVRTLSAAQFVAPGTSGSVRYVVVTGTLGTATDTLTVYRADPTTTAPRIYLSNPTHAVPTDEAGDNGDYSGAETEVQVFEGITDVTDDWSIAITPDAGVTATINGGAGPVTGTLSVTVAVSDMTIPDGAVLVTASKTGETDLTASFLVTKSESTGAYTVYWDPRSEIVLPADAAGNVLSYADAFSTLRILRAGVDDGAAWTFSKVDTNVTSTISASGRVDVTAMASLGTVSSTSDTAQTPWPSGWSYANQLIYGGGTWLMTGFGATTKVRTSADDMATWTERDHGLSSARRELGGYVGGYFVLTGGAAVVSDKAIRSGDGGITWTEHTLPASIAAYYMSRVGNELILSSGGTTCYRTSDGSSWSSYTAPDSGCLFAAAGSAWACVDLSANLRGSSNAGSSWSSAVNLTTTAGQSITGCYHVEAFRGLLVAFLYTVSAPYPTKVLVSANGTTWSAHSTPVAYQLPRLIVQVSGVLYMVDGASKLFWSTDGRTWAGGTATVPNDITPPAAYLRFTTVHDTWAGDFLPSLEVTSRDLIRGNLSATSDSEGAVTVTATKPGEFDIVRTLIVRKGSASSDIYTSYAVPAMLLLPATSDGVVTSYSNATITAYINRNGIDDTANWSWSYTTTNLTPASGSSNAATITAMSNSFDQGLISFRATKAGQQDITGTLVVNKVKGGEISGPRIGAAFNAISFTQTEIGLRFKSDGRFQVRQGSGGSWVDAGTWTVPVLSSNGSTYWIRVEATGHALSTGTTGSWLAMTSDRDYVLTEASSGTHTTNLQVMFATSSAGANAVLGFGSLQLVVP